MFNFLKKKDSYIKTAVGKTATESARVSTQEAAQKFAKPAKYDRKLYDSGAAKKNLKTDAFQNNATVRDPYTGSKLVQKKSVAKAKYGKNWTSHLAESDHKIPLEKRYNQTKNNPWLTTDDVKNSSNSRENMEVVSRKFNNAKRSKTNKEFVNDEEYLKKTGVKLSEEGKKKAIQSEKKAMKAMKRQDTIQSAKNIAKTSHSAGINAAKNAGVTGMTMSGILNMTAVIKGEKSADEAITDTIKDTGKAAATGYVMGGGLTAVSHSLSSSSSKFVSALAKSNVPGTVITAVIVTGDTLKRYGEGEITTEECLIELGEKGLNLATSGYAMAIGQAVIPIPVVGAAVGALVGSMLTSYYYNSLINELKTKQFEHEERLRIIAECEQAAEEARKFREELESYLESYFKDYKDCFDDALSTMHAAFAAGDADGVIAGANQITYKLGGNVKYNNMNEFKTYLLDDSTDVL